MATGNRRPAAEKNRIPRIRLASPDVGDEELEAIKAALFSGVLTNGPQTIAFEKAFASRHSVTDAVAFANGTVALPASGNGIAVVPLPK